MRPGDGLRVALAGAILALGFALGMLAGGQPHCPEEDTCRADYRDGGWHIDVLPEGSY